jgi:hypothetical protein
MRGLGRKGQASMRVAFVSRETPQRRRSRKAVRFSSPALEDREWKWKGKTRLRRVRERKKGWTLLFSRAEGRIHSQRTKGEKGDWLATTTTTTSPTSFGRVVGREPQGGQRQQMQGDICSLCRRGCVKDDTGVRPPRRGDEVRVECNEWDRSNQGNATLQPPHVWRSSVW